MNVRAPLIMAVAATLAVPVLSRSRPDFTGRWIAVEPKTVAGHELLIVQDDRTIRIEQQRLRSREAFDEFGRRGGRNQEREVTTYTLDGAATVTVINEATETVSSSIRWNGDRLVLVDSYQPNLIRFERTLSLDTKGRLVLAVSRRPTAPDADAASGSEHVLDPSWIVFEKR